MPDTALLFSGQGAQYTGMGVKLKDYPAGRETFQEANDILGIDITNICCNGSDEELANTEITQPAIVTCSIAALRILQRDLEDSPIDGFSAVAGLSVGEYSALVAGGALGFSDALKLVRERGRLMNEAAAANPGVMVAILGLDSEVVDKICEEASDVGVVSSANYNCPGQVVISGEDAAVQKAVELAGEAGAKKCKHLSVSGAFHSALMQSAESGLRKVLDDVPFSRPEVKFVANVTADYLDKPKSIREALALQLSNSIHWEASIHRIVDSGINNFVEVGPGKVLAGLMRRISRDSSISSTDKMMQE